MIVYTTLYLMSIFTVILSIAWKKSSTFLLYTFMILLIIISGFRYGVGADFFSYAYIFELIRSDGWGPVDFAFVEVSLIVLGFGVQNQFLYLLFAAITLLFFAHFYRRYAYNPVFAMVLFALMPILFFGSFNGIRQFLAMGIFLFSLRFLVNRKLLHYMLVVLIASLFHKSALLMLPLYFIVHLQSSMQLYMLLFLVYVVMLQFANYILYEVVGFSYVYTLYPDRYDGSLGFKIYPLILLFVGLFFIRKHLTQSFSANNVFINMLYLGILIMLTPLFMDLPYMMVMRVSLYFLMVLPVLLVNVMPIIIDQPMKRIYFVFVLSSVSFYYFFTLSVYGEAYRLLPYSSNFEIF